MMNVMNYTFFFIYWGKIMKKDIKQNFYVMDHRLKNSDNDRFGHSEIADNIVNLINNERYMSPYNIALIGKWGLGKSSILTMVKEKLAKTKNIKIVEINAWKYERESLKNECLKNIYEEVSGNKINFIQQLELVFNKIFRKDNKKKESRKEKIINLLSKVLPIIIPSLIISFVWQLANFLSNGHVLSDLLKYNLCYLFFKYLDFYFDKILFTLCVPIFVSLVPKLADKQQNIFPLQINYENDYETLLKKIVQKQENNKFLIIIDDLDRLSTKKIVEALDTLKILMEIDRCIFIVPFDDSILKNVLNKKVVSEIDNEQQIIQSELILDKLFQFRFYVPPLIISDMKSYTLDIIKNESTDLYNIFDSEEIDEIVKKVFMYNGLQTPRQIKKIINTFSNNILLFKERVESNKINSNLFDKNGKLMLAKISVLQSDFNDFYDDLFNDPKLCEDLINANKKNYKDYKEIPNNLKKYFKNNPLEIQNKYNDLLNFLSRTAYIKSEDISIYLYCNQDKISNIFGSSFNRRLHESMSSMNFPLMNKIIKEENTVNLHELLVDYLEGETIYNLPMIVVSILNIDNLDINNDLFCRCFIDSIANIYNSEETLDLKYINLYRLLELKKKYFDDEVLTNLLNKYIDFLNDNVDSDEFPHKKNYEIIIENINLFSNIKTDVIKKYFSLLYNQEYYYIDLLNKKNIDESILNEYFGVGFYDYLVTLIYDCEDDEEYKVYYNLVIKMYAALKHEASSNGINEKIIDLLKIEKHLRLCENIIKNNINNFDVEEQMQIIKEIETKNSDNLELQYNIINCISFDISNENNNLQNKICAFIENNYNVENILNNMSNYEFADIIIEKINSKIYLNSDYDSIYNKNIKKFTKKQLENLISTLSTTINGSTYKEGRLSSVLNIVGNLVDISQIIITFTTDDLIKNRSSSNEITGIIKKFDNINKINIDNYIKRNIELLPTNKNIVFTIEKLTLFISDSNVKILTSTVNVSLINDMNREQLQSVFNVYKNILINENNKSDVITGLNALKYSTIESTVIKHMLQKNIIITDSFEFIMSKINNIEELKSYNNISNILSIDDDFISKIIEDIKQREYSVEQLLYIISLDEKILPEILSLKLEYNSDNLYSFLNIQKLIFKSKSEHDLTIFQVDILQNADENFIESIIEQFIPIKKAENIKLIRIALQKIVDKKSISNLLLEKIMNLSNKNKYRIVNRKKELVKS